MKVVTKTYNIREKDIFSDGTACLMNLPFSDGTACLVNMPFSNCENHKRIRIIYNSVCYSVPTAEMFTPEASRNRKYQIRQ